MPRCDPPLERSYATDPCKPFKSTGGTSKFHSNAFIMLQRGHFAPERGSCRNTFLIALISSMGWCLSDATVFAQARRATPSRRSWKTAEEVCFVTRSRILFGLSSYNSRLSSASSSGAYIHQIKNNIMSKTWSSKLVDLAQNLIANTPSLELKCSSEWCRN